MDSKQFSLSGNGERFHRSLHEIIKTQFVYINVVIVPRETQSVHTERCTAYLSRLPQMLPTYVQILRQITKYWRELQGSNKVSIWNTKGLSLCHWKFVAPAWCQDKLLYFYDDDLYSQIQNKQTEKSSPISYSMSASGSRSSFLYYSQKPHLPISQAVARRPFELWRHRKRQWCKSVSRHGRSADLWRIIAAANSLFEYFKVMRSL